MTRCNASPFFYAHGRHSGLDIHIRWAIRFTKPVVDSGTGGVDHRSRLVWGGEASGVEFTAGVFVLEPPADTPRTGEPVDGNRADNRACDSLDHGITPNCHYSSRLERLREVEFGAPRCSVHSFVRGRPARRGKPEIMGTLGSGLQAQPKEKHRVCPPTGNDWQGSAPIFPWPWA